MEAQAVNEGDLPIVSLSSLSPPPQQNAPLAGRLTLYSLAYPTTVVYGME